MGVHAVVGEEGAPVIIKSVGDPGGNADLILVFSVHNSHVDTEIIGHLFGDRHVVGPTSGRADPVGTGAHHNRRSGLGLPEDTPVSQQAHIVSQRIVFHPQLEVRIHPVGESVAPLSPLNIDAGNDPGSVVPSSFGN